MFVIVKIIQLSTHLLTNTTSETKDISITDILKCSATTAKINYEPTYIATEHKKIAHL